MAKKITHKGNYKERLQTYKRSLELAMKGELSNVSHCNSQIRHLKETIENCDKSFRLHMKELKRVQREISKLK